MLISLVHLIEFYSPREVIVDGEFREEQICCVKRNLRDRGNYINNKLKIIGEIKGDERFSELNRADYISNYLVNFYIRRANKENYEERKRQLEQKLILLAYY